MKRKKRKKRKARFSVFFRFWGSQRGALLELRSKIQKLINVRNTHEHREAIGIIFSMVTRMNG